jgi:hypothetical protein
LLSLAGFSFFTALVGLELSTGAAWNIGDATTAGTAFLRVFFSVGASELLSTAAAFLDARLRGAFGSSAMYTKSFLNLIQACYGLKLIKQILCRFVLRFTAH